ncbi:MAG: hypothetical protein RJA70_2689 [Pseudomonadota bacterium]
MRAIVATEPGGPGVLRVVEVASPEPTVGQVRIDVHATALNRADLLQRRGLYPPPTGESEILGLECAGVVSKVGPDTSAEWLGRRVASLLGSGGYAEQVVTHERLLLPIPDTMSFEEAAAIPEAFLTASEALFTRANLRPRERVLIHAAAGGVGSAAVQLAVRAGAVVFASAGTPEKCAFVEQLGARCFLRTAENFEEQVREAVEADVVIDFIGGAYWPLHSELMAVGARLVVVGVLGGAIAEVHLGKLLRMRQSLLGMVMRSLPLSEKVELTQRFIRLHSPGFFDGSLRPLVDRVFDFGDVSSAHERMDRNANMGKIVLRVR